MLYNGLPISNSSNPGKIHDSTCSYGHFGELPAKKLQLPAPFGKIAYLWCATYRADGSPKARLPCSRYFSRYVLLKVFCLKFLLKVGSTGRGLDKNSSHFIVGFGMFCTRTFVRFVRTQKLRLDNSECRGP